MKIREVMRPGPITILDTDPLGAAQRAMARAGIRHLPVMGDGKLVGMLSERDVLAARARADAGDDWWRLPVRDAMSAPAQTAAPDASLTEIAGRLAAGKLGAMPVVERGALVGLVTITDVLDAEVRSAMAPTPTSQATAADVMTPFPLTTRPEALLVDAARVMRDHHVRHLPVVAAGSTIVGMLSDRDVRTALGEPSRLVGVNIGTFASYQVRDAMNRRALIVSHDLPLAELAHRFVDDRVSAIPVTDGFGALIGIVSFVDLLRVLAA